MCGIAAFLSTESWRQKGDVAAFADIVRALDPSAAADWVDIAAVLDRLAALFAPLNGFGVHAALCHDDDARQTLATLATRLGALGTRAAEDIARHGRTDLVEQVKERLADYRWQVEAEVLANLDKVARLMPVAPTASDRASHFLAWAAETVLQSLDRLEVRGRDSAGIGLLLALEGEAAPEAGLTDALAAEFARLAAAPETAARQIRVGRDEAGQWTVRATYKVANLVGRLGDNGAGLRAAIRADALLWALAPRLAAVNILAHTRWASNGVISVPNCHPIDGRLAGLATADAGDAAFVLNGDVDNYATLVASSVAARGLAIDPAVSTDAKILPVTFALATAPTASLRDRFAEVMRHCQGSLAIVLQHMAHSRRLMVGQKGSGQALYVGAIPDGALIASEVYGLASLCRSVRPLAGGSETGAILSLDATSGERIAVTGRTLADDEDWMPAVEPIQIFARDIFRGDFPTYIEKEVGEAPDGVRKTLLGKYRATATGIEFLIAGFGHGDQLVRRLTARDRPPLRRIIVIGQGTAAVAGMGIAHLIRQSVAAAGVTVGAGTASELFGFVGEERFDDALVVAVSQSGTTTDTNRIVDLAKSRGAWIHAIVNRRNSSLVQKAHSFLYTSDGRDVEMSVASTKAYYAQVAAGKLLGLLLASHLGSLPERRIAEEISALEALPGHIARVLANREAIAAIAARLAPFARNWALVGNGANRIAAEEIRIKLSELCYKAIPCDVTENKKHIDLSTEPMTLVVANDLPEAVVSDTVKEVSIFKAHSGRPVVLCAEGENRFAAVAEAVIPLPVVGGGLDFVVATVAGHLFGIAAAQAIDAACGPFRDVRAVLSRETQSFRRIDLVTALDRALALIATGGTDTALSARLAVRLAQYQAWLIAQPESLTAANARLDEARAVVNAAIDDLTRPIDTIRHQAKTVTVGISRPQAEVSPLVLAALNGLGVAQTRLAERDRDLLAALSPLVTDVSGAVLYDVTATGGDPDHPQWDIQAVRVRGAADLAASRYHSPRPADGSKRKALRTGGAVTTTGAAGDRTAIVLPLAAPSGTVLSGLLLLHLMVAPTASLQQKLAVLKRLDHKHDELIERMAERLPAHAADGMIAALDPALLFFAPVERILDTVRAVPSP